MTTFSLRRFTQPEALKKIERVQLLRFLGPYGEFFKERGVDLPRPEDTEGIDYEALAEVFMTPDADTPLELANALYFVHELATPEGMDRLLAEAERKGISFGESSDLTPADVAIRVWLEDPEILQRKHAEQAITRVRSFEYFQMDSEHKGKEQKDLNEPPSKAVLEALQNGLDAWFEAKRRGRGSRVFVYSKGKEMRFSVRHGDPFRREPSLEQGEPGMVFYRPEKYDVVVYNPALGELRLNARSKGEKDLYRKMFGLHLFGDEEAFPDQGNFTLDPLKENGAESLVSSDVEGLESVVLREVQFYWGGPENEVEIRKADDLFAAFAARNRKLPKARPVSAKFEVKFDQAKATRMVTIRPSNIAQYVRDSDAEILEKWFLLRGFVRSRRRLNAAA